MTVSGSRIRLARHRKSMTQRQLAQTLGVSEKNIVRWENNQHTPRADSLAAIAKATGQDLAFFLEDGDEEVAPEGAPFRGGSSRGAPVVDSGASESEGRVKAA